MTFDDYFSSWKLYTGLAQRYIRDDGLLGNLQSAVGRALMDRFPTEKAVGSLVQSLRSLEETQSSIKDLLNFNTGFSDRLKPSVYIEGWASAARTVQSFVDTSWMKTSNPWLTRATALTQINTDGVKGFQTAFTRLVEAEKETGRVMGLTGLDTQITSVAAQLASVFQSQEDGLRGLGVSARLLSDFNGFAINQHREIQKAIGAGRDYDVDWRLGLLDATSKFVDRQIQWGNHVASVVEEAGWEVDPEWTDSDAISENDEDCVESTSFFTAIPQEIGYSKREDSQISPEEALEKSKLARITELGFGIVNRVLEVNKLQNDLLEDSVFAPTTKSMWIIGKLGQFICDSDDKFRTMITSLYSLIYENNSRIKKMLGNGDEKTGDQMIRECEYECIFRIKDLRTDFEHDIEHGDIKKREHKKAEINAAYRFYARKRPSTSREYKQFQIQLYEDVIVLLDRFIQIIEARAAVESE